MNEVLRCRCYVGPWDALHRCDRVADVLYHDRPYCAAHAIQQLGDRAAQEYLAVYA